MRDPFSKNKEPKEQRSSFPPPGVDLIIQGLFTSKSLPFCSYFKRMNSHHINKCGQRYQHIALISGYPTNTLEIKIIENNCFTQSVYFYIRRKLNWPGELAQWLKCLPYMSEDLSSIPSIHTKSSTWPIL